MASSTRNTTSARWIASRARRREKYSTGERQLRGRLDPRGVDQAERVHPAVAALEFEGNLDRVAGRARDGAHDQPVALQEPVGQRRLAHVGPADEAKAERIGRRLGRARAAVIRRPQPLERSPPAVPPRPARARRKRG